jgi:hypothetical protein
VDSFPIFMLSICGGAAIIYLPLMWLAYRDLARKREKSHAERMRSLELGIPLPDAQVARFGALRWIGIGVPLASLSAAVAATWFLVPLRESGLFLGVLGTVWVTCGVVCLVALSATLARLRESSAERQPAVKGPTLPAGVLAVSPANQPLHPREPTEEHGIASRPG